MTSPGSGQEGGTGPKPPYPSKPQNSYALLTRCAEIIRQPLSDKRMQEARETWARDVINKFV